VDYSRECSNVLSRGGDIGIVGDGGCLTAMRQQGIDPMEDFLGCRYNWGLAFQECSTVNDDVAADAQEEVG
jgi:hypothetical protein